MGPDMVIGAMKGLAFAIVIMIVGLLCKFIIKLFNKLGEGPKTINKEAKNDK